MNYKQIQKQVSDFPTIPIEQHLTKIMGGEEYKKYLKEKLEKIPKEETEKIGKAQITIDCIDPKGKYKVKFIKLVGVNHKNQIKKYYHHNPKSYLEDYIKSLGNHIQYIFKKYPKLIEDDILTTPLKIDNRFCEAFKTLDQSGGSSTDLREAGGIQ